MNATEKSSVCIFRKKKGGVGCGCIHTCISIRKAHHTMPKKLEALLTQKSQVNTILRMKVIKKHTLFQLKRGTSVF